MKKSHLITPLVNNNGNSAEDLIQKLRNVMDRLRDVEAAMADANDVCHGRNFQTMPNGEVRRLDAQQAWGERRMDIVALREEVQELALSIFSQTQERQRK
jgi:hypothetical protein